MMCTPHGCRLSMEPPISGQSRSWIYCHRRRSDAMPHSGGYEPALFGPHSPMGCLSAPQPGCEPGGSLSRPGPVGREVGRTMHWIHLRGLRLAYRCVRFRRCRRRYADVTTVQANALAQQHIQVRRSHLKLFPFNMSRQNCCRARIAVLNSLCQCVCMHANVRFGDRAGDLQSLCNAQASWATIKSSCLRESSLKTPNQLVSNLFLAEALQI